MAGNYEQLKDIINNPTQHGLPAWDNDAKEIEGLNIKQYLLSIINSLTVGYQFMGMAMPTTNPGTPDQNIFYIAISGGIYANFGNIELNVGLNILRYNGSWSADVVINFDKIPTYGSNKAILSGGIYPYMARTNGATVTPSYTNGKNVDIYGNVHDASGYGYTGPILLQPGQTIVLNNGEPIYHGGNVAVLFETDSNGVFVKTLISGYTTYVTKIEAYTNERENAMYVEICGYTGQLKYYISTIQRAASYDFEQNFSEQFRPLISLGGYNIVNNVIVANANYSLFYIPVKTGDKIQIFMQRGQIVNGVKYWQIGSTAILPAPGVSVSNITDTATLVPNKDAQYSNVFDIASDGYLVLSYYSAGETTVAGNIAYRINTSTPTSVILEEIKDAYHQQREDLKTIYPAALTPQYFSHLFIDGIYNTSNPVIPSQSIHDVRVSAKLGFKMLELNLLKTSDGVYICRHQVGTNIFQGLLNSNDEVVSVDVSQITYAELKANYRYNSVLPQFRTPVLTLEETLLEMRKNNIQPYCTWNNETRPILEKYFGDRYVGYYGSNLASRPSDAKNIVLSGFNSSLSSVQAHKDVIDRLGAPMLHAIATPDTFTDAELLEIAAYAHQKGCGICWAACYSTEPTNHRMLNLGFDAAGSGWNVPEFQNGNVLDVQGDTISGFSGFVLSGGVVVNADGSLTIPADESITINQTAQMVVGKEQLEIFGSGTFNLVMGKYVNGDNFQITDNRSILFSTVLENRTGGFTITAIGDGLRIYGLDFKVSRVI